MKSYRYKNKGFNLIELLITLAIIGVLATLAYPNYREYVIQTRRSEGIAMLMQIMQQQERFFTEQLSYSVDLAALGYSPDPATGTVSSEGGHYHITASVCGDQAINRCVLLTATPQEILTATPQEMQAQEMQAQDGTLTLNSLGVRTPASAWE
ncbi:MAG: type IV pilin protein [Endozoicomonas sp.]